MDHVHMDHVLNIQIFEVKVEVDQGSKEKFMRWFKHNLFITSFNALISVYMESEIVTFFPHVAQH